VTILTDAGKDAVDGLSSAVQEIEEQVRERIEDAIRALDRYEPVVVGEAGPPAYGEAEMVLVCHGDYLDRFEVLSAVKRGAW
jgi:CHASE3 domain sensor protein